MAAPKRQDCLMQHRITLASAERPQAVKLTLAFDRQIERRQQLGGISRHFAELAQGLRASGAVDVAPSDRRGRRRAAIIHATYYSSWPYRLRPGQALVSSHHDMTPERHPELFPLGQLRSPHGRKAAWYEASQLILSNSAASADDLSFFWPQIQRPIRVIHLATGLDRVRPDPVPALEGRRFWLLVGKRVPYKNVLTVLRAFARLPHGFEAPILVCAGGGPFRASERRRFAQLPPAWRGAMLQMSADDRRLAWLYRQAEAVLVPSLAEGFSLPLIEALVCNTPVIASDLEAHREVAGPFAQALVPALNATAWAEALEPLLARPAPRPRCSLGERSYLDLCRHYGPERLVREHLDAYRSLAV